MSSHNNNIYIDPTPPLPPNTHTATYLFFLTSSPSLCVALPTLPTVHPAPIPPSPATPQHPPSTCQVNNLISYRWQPGQAVYDCRANLLSSPDCFPKTVIKVRGDDEMVTKCTPAHTQTHTHTCTALQIRGGTFFHTIRKVKRASV